MHQHRKKTTPARRLATKPAAALVLAAALAGCSVWGGAPGARAGFAAYQPGQGPLFLTGEWERYEGFVLEDEMAGAEGSRRYSTATLRGRPFAGSPSTDAGATYRMRIDLSAAAPTGPGRFALYAPRVEGFGALYIDGEAAYQRGLEASSPTLFSFLPESETVSIVLYSGPGDLRIDESGIVPTILALGRAGEMDRLHAVASGTSFFEIGYLFLLGATAFLLFLSWRNRREFLGFSIYMITVGLYYGFRDALTFQFFASSEVLHWAASIHTAGLNLMYLALAFYIWSLFRPRLHPALRLAIIAIPTGLAAAAFAFPPAIAAIAAASVGYSAVFVAAVIAWLVPFFARGDRNARWLLPAFCAVGAGIAIKFLRTESFAVALYAESATVLVFGGVCGLMLVRKMVDSFATVNNLSDYVTNVAATVRSFIPKEFLEYLEKDDVVDLRLGDHVKKEMTIFFSDIRAFTELSERLTVEENFAFINSYLSRVVPIIRENGGFVDKYLGDGILALYHGAKGPDEALRSAIAMQGKIIEYNGHRAKVGYCPIAMGIGIHTGDLMLGVVGVKDRMENTVISDSVNLASRLLAITKAFNITIAISERTFKELEDPGSYTYRFIGKVKVRGKAAPVSVFDIFDGIEPALFERKVRANTFFEQGMIAYYQKDFAGAISYFRRVIDIIPEDGAAAFYLENCMNKAAR